MLVTNLDHETPGFRDENTKKIEETTGLVLDFLQGGNFH